MLTYLEFMDEEGAFKTAAERGGRWPGWKAMLAEIANESYRMHATYNLVNGGKEAHFDTSEFEFIDPVVRKALDEREGLAASKAEQDVQDFEAEISFT